MTTSPPPSLSQAMAQALLNQAVHAAKTRQYWSAFPENPSPKVYGETAQADGQAAAEAYFGKDFPLQQTGTRSWVATEQSPYGVPLDVRYPDVAPQDLVAAAQAAEPGWQALGAQGRTGVLLEALARIHQRTHEITHAVLLTSGQGPMMAFQAGGPHAQDRALEAIAYAYKAQADVPAEATWEKPQGKNPPLVMKKHFNIVGRGIGLVIGCATFPTWNTYPGLFAALATGNAVIVKPHSNAVLPAAITVRTIRAVLAEAIEAGGSTLRDHIRADGSLGYFQHSFSAYDREKQACRTPGCTGIIGRIVQSGRSTFYCGHRQR